MVSRELDKECVVVFDEAHNIDNVCIEASLFLSGLEVRPSRRLVVGNKREVKVFLRARRFMRRR